MKDDSDYDFAIIGWKRMKEIVPISRTQVLRLEKQGAFPKRLRVSQNRVGWRLGEVKEWLLSRPRDV